MKKLGSKVISTILALIMVLGLLGIIGPIGVSADVEGDDVYLWPLYMEGVTGKGGTFDCYFGTGAQGKAIFASGTMQFNLYFPVAGNYYYEIICHNQWNASKKTMELWIDDDTDSASKHSDYPSNPSEAPLTGSLVVPTSGLHRLNLKGSLAIGRLKIRGIARFRLV